MNSTILFVQTATTDVSLSVGYLIGAIIAFMILGYLLYSLIKPEDF